MTLLKWDARVRYFFPPGGEVSPRLTGILVQGCHMLVDPRIQTQHKLLVVWCTSDATTTATGRTGRLPPTIHATQVQYRQ